MIDLKDRFAMAAMVAILRRENKPQNYSDVAREAYRYADFMMEERQEQIDQAALDERRKNGDMQTLKLSTRLHYALLSEDLYSISDICNCTKKEILKIRNIGPTQLANLIFELAAVGKTLAAPREK